MKYWFLNFKEHIFLYVFFLQLKLIGPYFLYNIKSNYNLFNVGTIFYIFLNELSFTHSCGISFLLSISHEKA